MERVKSTEFEKYHGFVVVQNENDGLWLVKYEQQKPLGQLEFGKGYGWHGYSNGSTNYSLTVPAIVSRNALATIGVRKTSQNCYQVFFADLSNLVFKSCKTYAEIHDFLKECLTQKK